MSPLEQVLQNIAREDDTDLNHITEDSDDGHTSSPLPTTATKQQSWPSAPSLKQNTVHPPNLLTPSSPSSSKQRLLFQTGSPSSKTKRDTTHKIVELREEEDQEESLVIEKQQEKNFRRNHRMKSRKGGILDKTANHLERRKLWRERAAKPDGKFKPDISEYSKQLKRNEPVHQRLFRVGKQNLVRKRERIIHDSKYDWESGNRLFHPKTNTTYSKKASVKLFSNANDSYKNSNSIGVPKSIAAGNRLYRNALHSRAKLREKQIAELLMQEQNRQKVRMSPQSRHFARKKVERELQAVFQRLNTSGSGLLTFEELSDGMASVHINMPSSVVDRNNSNSADSGTLSMPDMLFWSALAALSGEQQQQNHVDLVTFISVSYRCLEEADPTWTPLAVTNRSLTQQEVIVTWCRAWIEALAIGGKTPYGHVQPSDGRHRWKQDSKSALGTEYNNFSGTSYRHRKSKLAYESPDDRECTFQPKLTKHSRALDRKRMGNGSSVSDGGIQGANSTSRIDLMLMLHQRKEEKLNVQREKKLHESMEECTFSPVIKHSSRSLRMVRKSMAGSDRNRFSGDANRDVPAHVRLYDQHVEHLNKKYKELTSEQREFLDYCTFQPNLKLRQGEADQGEGKEGVKVQDATNCSPTPSLKSAPFITTEEALTEYRGDTKTNDIDSDLMADISERMPWENAVPRSKLGSTNLSTTNIPKGDSPLPINNMAVSEIKPQTKPFFAAGVHDHTLRIRNARLKKKQKEHELQLMGKSSDYVRSLRMDLPEKNSSQKGNAVIQKKTLETTKYRQDHLLLSPQHQSEEGESPTSGKVSIPPALRMRVQAADGGSQTIEIYAGDSPSAVAAKFAHTHSLDTEKTHKLQQLIAVHMAKNQIPMNV